MKSASDRFGLPSAMHFLLPQHVKRASSPRRARRRDRRRCRRPRSPPARSRRRRARVSSLLVDDAVEQRLRVVVQLARRRAVLRDARGSPGSVPSAPTPRRRTSSRCTARAPRAARRRARGGRRTPASAIASVVPVDRQPVGAAPASYGSSGRSLRALCCSRSCLLQRRGWLRRTRRAARRSAGSTTTSTDARRVEHVHRRSAVLRRDLHRRVLPAGRRAADEQRQRACRAAPSPCATNTISSSDGVIRPLSPMMSAFSSIAVCEDLVARHHHAEIDRPRSCCSRARRRRCSCRCRGRRP